MSEWKYLYILEVWGISINLLYNIRKKKRKHKLHIIWSSASNLKA